MSSLSSYDWQSRAIAAYRQQPACTAEMLQAELAARLQCLTGQAPDPQAIYVDCDAEMAVARLDGAVFRLRGQCLRLVRPCPSCGLGHYESAPIDTVAELGYALGAWQPPCANCQPEDPLEM